MRVNTKISLCALLCAALLVLSPHRVMADSTFRTYSGAVTGDVVYLGRINGLFNNDKSYAARDCQAKFLDDDRALAGASLEILDYDPNERVAKDSVHANVPTYLLARTGSQPGTFGYEVKCGNERGTGVLRVSSPNDFSVGELTTMRLEVGNDTAANKTQYLVLNGIEGNNLTASLDSSDSYFNDFIGKLRQLKFYQRNDDDSLSVVDPANFDKILPLREISLPSSSALIDVKDLNPQLAVLENDGNTVSYYELQTDKKLGLVYVYTGNKKLNVPKGKQLTHCFPTLRKGAVVNYYCLYEDIDAKKPGAMVYYDLASTNENLEPRTFDGVKTILTSSPILSEDRTCLLAIGNDGKKRVLCLDATHGLDKNKDNENTYFQGRSIKINRGEDCVLNVDSQTDVDFNFVDAPIFTCASGAKVTASYSLDNTYEADQPGVSKVKTFMPVNATTTVLCVDDDEIIYTENRNQSLVIQGGANRPGQLLKYPMPVVGVTDFAKVHCARDNVILLLDTKKKTYIMDIKRGGRDNLSTRLNSLIELPADQNRIKVASGSSAILYNINKKGLVADVVEYNSFLGLVKVLNSDYTQEGSHSTTISVRSGKNVQKIKLQTDLVNYRSLEVTKIKSMSGLKPGNSYPIRDYFNVKGQIWSIEYRPLVHSVYMHPDQVSFEHQHNSTSGGARFSVGDYYVDTKERTYSFKGGDSKKLKDDTLAPSRLLGSANLERETVFIGKRDGKTAYVQGWFVDGAGEVRATDIVKLDTDFLENIFYDSPQSFRSGDKSYVLFNRGSGKGRAIEYKYVPEDKTIVLIGGSQIDYDWNISDRVNGFRLSGVDEHSGSRLAPCAHIKLEDNGLKAPIIYSLCDVTGGSSDRLYIRNLYRAPDGTVRFDLFNHPAAESGINAVSWWNVTATMFGQDGKPVAPEHFVYTATLKKRFNGLGAHTVRSVSPIGEGNYAVISSLENTKDSNGLYESYYGNGGDTAYLHRRYTDDKTSWNDYELTFAPNGNRAKRIYYNFGKDFSNVADVVFTDAHVRLSPHTASAHVKNPFTLDFNKGQHIEPNYFLDLDKYYPDDGKTDHDDEKPKPPIPDDPVDPERKPRKSRLWIILGILLLIILIGAGDLYLRRRSALEEAESELDKEKPKNKKKKATGVNEGEEHLTGSINEM